jgi:DNA-binding transcriptional LysR family regulator
MTLDADTLRHRLLARGRLRHWLGFARVAELGSVRKAAEAIGMAQPALTGLLSDLESLLGEPLFERHARGMRLTPMGRELLPAAHRLLGAIDDVAEQTVALQDRTQRVVRVGAIGGAVAGVLAPALPALAAAHPDLLVQLIEADTFQLEAIVARGEVDVALCRAPASVPHGWCFEPLLQDRFAVVAGSGHALRRYRTWTLDQLRRHTWLAMPAGTAARTMFEALFADPLPPMCQVSSRIPTVLWSMLRAQPLLALIPASVVRPWLQAGELVELPLQRTMAMPPIGALTREADARHGVQRLLDSLRRVQGADRPSGWPARKGHAESSRPIHP